MNKISIVIPILNEAKTIGKLLNYIKHNSSQENIADIIVVDGGSDDGSIQIVKSEPNITLINSAKGRAKQMNKGASYANGSILYFLHADSLPPKDFDKHIIQAVENNHKAGCFRMQFEDSHWWLRLASWLTQFRWRACRGGDQSQFITKVLFENIGGYDERYIIYEDNILINELYKRKEFTVLQHKIRTSARCYKRNGIWRLQYHFWAIYVKKWFGASAEELYRYYKKHIT